MVAGCCVTQASEILAAIRTARSEAQNAFGSGELILEQAVINPRHVELQIFADQHGYYFEKRSHRFGLIIRRMYQL